MTAADEAYLTARAQVWIALGSVVHGYWCTVATVDRFGRKSIQLMRFAMITLMMVTALPCLIKLFLMRSICSWFLQQTTTSSRLTMSMDLSLSVSSLVILCFLSP